MPAKSFELGRDSSYRGSSYRESAVSVQSQQNNVKIKFRMKLKINPMIAFAKMQKTHLTSTEDKSQRHNFVVNRNSTHVAFRLQILLKFN